MQHDYESLMDKGTWGLVDFSTDRTIVNKMWIYKIKSDTYGEESRYKARLVAKGCIQRAGLDNIENFSPVMRIANLRLFLAIAAPWTSSSVNLTSTPFLYAPVK
jgi:hypothetical protein